MKGLAKDTLWYGVAAFLTRGIGLLLLPLYTHILEPGDYGALDTILILGNLLTLIIPLEISQAVARHLASASSHEERRRVASTALWFTVGAYFGVVMLILPISQRLSVFLLDSHNHTLTLRIGIISIAFTGIFYLIQTQLRFELRSREHATISIVYAILTALFSIMFGLIFEMGLLGIVCAQLCASIATVLIGMFQLRSTYSRYFGFDELRALLHFSIPLVPSALAVFLMLYGNRVLINGLVGLDALGVFGVAARIASVAGLPMVGFQSALTPLIYAHHQEADTPARLARLFEGFSVIAGVGCLILGLFAFELLSLFADPAYAEAAPFVIWLAPAAIISQMYVFFPGIAIAQKTHLQLAIFALTASVSLVANWMLITLDGLRGAASATLLSALLFMALWVRVSHSLYPVPVRWPRIAVLCMALIAVALVCALLRQEQLLPAITIPLRIMCLFAVIGLAQGLGLIRVAELSRVVQRG